MRTDPTAIALLLIISLPGAFLCAQPERPFYAAGPLDSPRIAALDKAVKAANGGVTVAFWQEIRKDATSLVEPVSRGVQKRN